MDCNEAILVDDDEVEVPNDMPRAAPTMHPSLLIPLGLRVSITWGDSVMNLMIRVGWKVEGSF